MAHYIANYVKRENKLDTPYKTLSTPETCHCESETTSVHGENLCKLSMFILHEVDVLFRQLCASLSSLKDVVFLVTNFCNNLNFVKDPSFAYIVIGKGQQGTDPDWGTITHKGIGLKFTTSFGDVMIVSLVDFTRSWCTATSLIPAYNHP